MSTNVYFDVSPQLQINNFMENDDFPKSKSLSELNKNEICNISGNSLVLLGKKVSELSAHQISCLTTSQISSLSPEQIAILNPEQISCLKQKQLLEIKDNQRSKLKPGDPLELKIVRAQSRTNLKKFRKSNSYLNKKLAYFLAEHFCDTNDIKGIGRDLKICRIVSAAISTITVLPLVHDVGVYLYNKTRGIKSYS